MVSKNPNYFTSKKTKTEISDKNPKCSDVAKLAEKKEASFLQFEWYTQDNKEITGHYVSFWPYYENNKYTKLSEEIAKYSSEKVKFLNPSLQPITSDMYEKQYEYIIKPMLKPITTKYSKVNAVMFGYDEKGFWDKQVWMENNKILDATNDKFLQDSNKPRYLETCTEDLRINIEGQLEFFDKI